MSQYPQDYPTSPEDTVWGWPGFNPEQPFLPTQNSDIDIHGLQHSVDIAAPSPATFDSEIDEKNLIGYEASKEYITPDVSIRQPEDVIPSLFTSSSESTLDSSSGYSFPDNIFTEEFWEYCKSSSFWQNFDDIPQDSAAHSVVPYQDLDVSSQPQTVAPSELTAVQATVNFHEVVQKVKPKRSGKVSGGQSNRKTKAPKSTNKKISASPKKKEDIRCELCHNQFTRKSNLKAHMETHNPNRVKPHKCPHDSCQGKAFTRSHDLKRHLQTTAHCARFTTNLTPALYESVAGVCSGEHSENSSEVSKSEYNDMK
ncbi:hypothetical protein C8Q75DRAFT_804908 [Abortiporus biennis]|nr:hypothetical protein C8Q75DRAFT_804908 [Abortiporus biennis]